MSDTIYIPKIPEWMETYEVPYGNLDEEVLWEPPEDFYERAREGHNKHHGIPPTNAFESGNVPWNKGLTNVQRPWSESRRKKQSERMKQKHLEMGHVEGGKKYVKRGASRIDNTTRLNKTELTCPHCNKVGNLGNMKRWHFDNCKVKNV